MQRLQAELRKAKLLFNVEIVGVNAAISNVDAYNQLVSLGNPLPWVQDTTTNHVWQDWAVTYRDLRILDASNRVAAVFNLTLHDLGDSENYETAKALFISIANKGDANQNGLPDAWEDRYLAGRTASPDEDPDGDGYSNFLEYAFGTNPLDPSSHPAVAMSFTASGQGTVSFLRWAGTRVNYPVDGATNLSGWTAATSFIQGASTNLFDGTGRLLTRYTLTQPLGLQSNAFIRVQLRADP